MVLCTFCNKDYKNKYSLKAHQERSSCLKNKPEYVEPLVFQCSLCDKYFAKKQNLEYHESICPLREGATIKKTLKNLQLENNMLKNKVDKLTEENDNYRQKIDELNSLVLQLSAKMLNDTKTSTVINDNRKIQVNIRIKNYIKASPECMSVENLQKYAPKLTISHILSEGGGYGRFVVQYIKDNIRMITTDASRRVVFYKGENGKIVKDIGLINFFIMFCKAYSVRVKDLIKSLQDTLNLYLSEPDNLEQYRGYTKHVTQIKQGSNGDKVDFISSALKVITSGTEQNNLIC